MTTQEKGKKTYLSKDDMFIIKKIALEYVEVIKHCRSLFANGVHKYAVETLEDTILEIKKDKILPNKVKGRIYGAARKSLNGMYAQAPELVDEHPDIEILK